MYVYGRGTGRCWDFSFILIDRGNSKSVTLIAPRNEKIIERKLTENVAFSTETFQYSHTNPLSVWVLQMNAHFQVFFIFHVHVSYQSLRPLSLKLFLVSLVMSGAAGHCVWLTPTSEDPAPTGFSCDRAFSRREGVWLSLGSDSPAGPSAPPSSRGNKLGRKVQQFRSSLSFGAKCQSL